ncbi:MAG: adenylate/guanylate cyclase domain-containing protein [Methylomonas sp.]
MKQMMPDADMNRLQEIVAAETGINVEPDTARRLYSAFSGITSNEQTAVEGYTVQEVTVLLADLRGFSAISEAYPPEVIFDIINIYLARMCEIAIANRGTIDKFMGDAIMLLFGVPQHADDDVQRAVTCAVQMQNAMDEINHKLVEKGLPELYMGAGINTGIVSAGMMGSDMHKEYTVIGDGVNIASRIETFSLRGQVLISEATYDRCNGFVVTGAPMVVRVKGKAKPVLLREVQEIPSLGLTVSRRDVRKSPRVDAMLPFTFYLIVDKIVQAVAGSGIALDIGYQGMLAHVAPGLMLYADILIKLDLSLFGAQSEHIYARVRSTRPHQGGNIVGIEFTSLDPNGEQAIRRFVQLLIQGSLAK